MISGHLVGRLLQIQLSTVEACIQANVGRYFYASSACVYNTDLQKGPIHLKESDAYPALPERGYGEAKLAGERLAECAMKDRGLETRVARYHNVMGAPGSWSDGKEKAPAAICRKVAEAKKSGDFVIDIWGDGSQVRSYLDVRDCVAGTLTVMRSDYPQPLNVGSDRMVTVDQLVDMVEDIAGVTLERRYDRSAPKGVAGRNSNNTLVTKETGWAPRVKLEDALAELYGWVEAQVYG
jgi:nucleoside-diphosphate-sugar epimerase